MSQASIDFIALVRSCIPEEAEIVTLLQDGSPAAILYGDVDRDGKPEITAMYRYLDGTYLFSLKEYGGNWFPIGSAATGRQQGVRDFIAAPISRKEGCDLIIGWQRDDGSAAELDIVSWAETGFQRLIPIGTTYHHLEVEDMPTRGVKDGVCELAIWLREQGQAFRVDTYRWEPYRLVPAEDTHSHYFQKVARYYEALVGEQPDRAELYRGYLEEAKRKSSSG